MITGGLPFILAETCARLVESGIAHAMRKASVTELATRERLVRELLDGFDFESHPHVPFLWLKLPDPWMSGTFKNAAFRDGVLVDDEDEFKAARADKVYRRVRIGFSSPKSKDALENGLIILRSLLERRRLGLCRRNLTSSPSEGTGIFRGGSGRPLLAWGTVSTPTGASRRKLPIPRTQIFVTARTTA